MGKVSLIIPEDTVNIFDDPKFDLDPAVTTWNAVGDGVPVFTRVTTQQFFGTGCVQFAIGGGTWGAIRQSVVTAAGQTHTLSAMVRRSAGGAVTAAHTQAVFAGLTVAWDSITSVRDGWYRCVKTDNVAGSPVNMGVYLTEDASFVDACQIEVKAYRTTYCDGDQEGCHWLGADPTSDSARSAQSRAGGRVVDLDDYSLSVDVLVGLGYPPNRHNALLYALLAGGELDNAKIMPRVITLSCHTDTRSEGALYDARDNLIDALKFDRVATLQPVILRFEGDTLNPVETRCFYDAGLEGQFDITCYDEFPVRLISYDPYWYGLGEVSDPLDTNDNATMRCIAARLINTGQWDPVGPPAAVAAGVGGPDVNALAWGQDGYLYIGGDFTNWNGLGAAGNYIVRWNPVLGTYSTVGGGLSSIVHTLHVGPDGTLYAGGQFLAAGGDPAANYIAQWNGVAWSNVGGGPGVGVVTAVYAIETGLDGTLYVGGNFTNWAGVGANYVVQLSTAGVWSMLGAANLNSSVFALDVGPDGTLYLGGAFNLYGAANMRFIAAWDGTNMTMLGEGFNLAVLAVAVAGDGTVYAGGNFTQTGAAPIISLPYIAQWNGAIWSDLDGGMDNAVNGLLIGPDGMLFACGVFTQAGSITIADTIARWNGYTWAHLDVDLPGAPTVEAMEIVYVDPVVESNYDLYVGFNTLSPPNGYFGGDTVVTNPGQAAAQPYIEIARSGGTSAMLKTIRNETTGMEMLFDYALLDGETLTIDLRPGRRSILSSHFGNVFGRLLQDSDFASWRLLPGANLVTCFVDVVGATVTAFITWRNTHGGVSGAQ